MRIQIVNVSKAYGAQKRSERRALDGVDLEVAAGEFLTLVGPSGAGKSSLLRMVAGLESPCDGTVLLDGKPVMSIPPARRSIFLLFQDALLYPNLSARGNLELALNNKELSKSAITQRIDDVAARFRLSECLDGFPEELSNGERQRVALARGVLFEPSIMLLDEPLAGVDPELRFHLKRELVALRDRIGATMLCVTHNPTEGFTMGDRVAVMLGGKLQQVDTPDRVYREPANTFVAGFVGYPPINLVPGTLAEDAGSWRFIPDGFAGGTSGLSLPVSVPPNVMQGRPLILGVRPDDVLVAGPESEEERWEEAILERTEFYDGAVVHWLRCHAGALVARARDSEQRLRPGPVKILIRDSEWLWFDGGSLARVN